MERVLLVNTRPEDRRLAMIEDNRLCEFRWDTGQPMETGNIYLGTVVRVLANQGAAFVDFGAERPGYLNAGGLHKGDTLMVQVQSEATGDKGARLTQRIGLAGRFLVLEPGGPEGVRISRRIQSTQERQRLTEILEDTHTRDALLIARTAAQGRTRQEITQDLEFLLALWGSIVEKAAGVTRPTLLFQAMDLVMNAAQDLITLGCKRLVLDNEADYDRVLRFVDSVAPDFVHSIELYQGSEPLFTKWGITREIAGLTDRVVHLPGGGTLVIDETEAMTAIDVNTGTRTVEGDREHFVFRTNMTAVKEIARQVRLRNIGGLVVIDLLKMDSKEHREQVYQTLKELMKRDREYSKVLPVSALGLIEMARQRRGLPLQHNLTVTCDVCAGRGRHVTDKALASECVDALSEELARRGPGRVRLSANVQIIQTLMGAYAASLELLEYQGLKVVFTAIPGNGPREYRLTRIGDTQDE